MLSDTGRLEQLRVTCKRAEGSRLAEPAAAETRIEQAKDWRLEQSFPARPVPHSVSAQFVVTKHHAYCVVAVRGQVII